MPTEAAFSRGFLFREPLGRPGRRFCSDESGAWAEDRPAAAIWEGWSCGGELPVAAGLPAKRKSQKLWIPKYSSVTRLHTLRLVCFEGTLRDLIPYDRCHLVPPRQPLLPPPLPPPAGCRSRNMAALRWTRETWNIGKVARAVVVVHGKGADSVAGYPFISDVKIQTCLEQEWSEVTLVQGRDSNMEVTGERSLGEILWENKCQ